MARSPEPQLEAFVSPHAVQPIQNHHSKSHPLLNNVTDVASLPSSISTASSSSSSSSSGSSSQSGQADNDDINNNNRQDDELFFVHAILDHKVLPGGYKRYLVRWDGYGPADDTWEPKESFSGTADEILTEYELTHKAKPKKPTSSSSLKSKSTPAKKPSKPKPKSKVKATPAAQAKGKGKARLVSDDGDSSSEEERPLIKVVKIKGMSKQKQKAPTPRPTAVTPTPIAASDLPPSPIAGPPSAPAPAAAASTVKASSNLTTNDEKQPSPPKETASESPAVAKRPRSEESDAEPADDPSSRAKRTQVNDAPAVTATAPAVPAASSLGVRGISTLSNGVFPLLTAPVIPGHSRDHPARPVPRKEAPPPRTAPTPVNTASAAFAGMASRDALIKMMKTSKRPNNGSTSVPSGHPPRCDELTPETVVRPTDTARGSTNSTASVSSATSESTQMLPPPPTGMSRSTGPSHLPNVARAPSVQPPRLRRPPAQPDAPPLPSHSLRASPQDVKPLLLSQGPGLAAPRPIVGPFSGGPLISVRPPLRPNVPAERAIDPRSRAGTVPPVQVPIKATASSAHDGQSSSSTGNAAQAAVMVNAPASRASILAHLQNALATMKNSRLYERHVDTFRRLPLDAAFVQAIGMDPALALRVRGGLCSVIDGDSSGADNHAEVQALGGILIAARCRPLPPGSARGAPDFLFIHRRAVIGDHASDFVRWMSHSPYVQTFLFGDGAPVVPAFEIGFEIMPTMAALWEVEGRDAFFAFFNSYRKASRLSIHPKTLVGARVVNDRIALALMDKMRKHGIELTPELQLDFLPTEIPKVDRAALLSPIPFHCDLDAQTAVDSTVERLAIVMALSPALSSGRLSSPFRRKVMVNDRVTPSVENDARQNGVEVMTWAQLRSTMEDSFF